MFDPTIIEHKSCSGDICLPYLHDEFSILCWNVHKNNIKNPLFRPYLKSLVVKRDIDFILFQEANFKNGQMFGIHDFSFEAAANLEYGGEFYGVLTASRVEAIDSQRYLTKGKEAIWGTHKSLLLSYYPFRNRSKLLIINIHAINFREEKQYNIELDRVLELVQNYRGPMIVAGDFNTWSDSRMSRLMDASKKLSLKMVDFKDRDKIKSFMDNQLDFVFYRGLSLIESDVISHPKLSDHNPLYVKFRKI
ncbi:hypothetical protein MNB_SV-6-1024 [hydrothermal vent metagenome]|uniref:Endonuclease/exonuclease/phosphatase domain-containing protein n=1 Tax=hydrothermal vent metagenome TaxID=652676 RepID=A0A1W1C7V5_9ZZZZ